MSKMSGIKSVTLDLKLINLVKENPVLYDHNDARYMDFNAREVVWHKIGDEMKRPASECKARWINIRDINRRILRKTLRNPGGGRKMYKYYNELAFMRPFYRDVMIQNSELGEMEENSNNSKIEDDDDDNVNDQYSNDESGDDKPIESKLGIKMSPKLSTKKRKKRRLEAVEKTTSVSIDSTGGGSEFDPADKVDAFLLSIGATLKTFSPYHLNLAKSKIFAVVQEHELQQIVLKQGQSSDGPIE